MILRCYLLFMLVLFFPLSTYAGLSNLAQDFLNNNRDVQAAKAQIKLAVLDVEALEMTRNTSFQLNSNRNVNKLEAFSAFAARFAGGAFRQPITTTEHRLALNKGFEWGGDLAFDNTFQEFEVQGAQKIYGFTQGLTYTQNLGRDFLGKTFQLQKDSLLHNVNFAESNSESSIQNSLFELVRNYYQAALNKSLVVLQSQAKERAVRRLALIRRRVRDGLREKVDRIQAEISLYRAEENVKSAKQNLASSVENLSTAVHRNVSEEEIIGLIDKAFERTIKPKGSVEENNNLQAFKSRLEATRATLKQADASLLPQVNLEVAARNNKFNPNTGDTVTEGLIGGANHEFRVGVNVTWPLGSKPQEVEKTRALVNYETNKIQFEKFSQDVFQSEKSIKDQINLLDNNLKSSQKRMDLAQKALNEYNRLYARGRADLDQLIRAEETLIETEINHVQYLSQREILVHSLSFLYGNLVGFLTEETK